LRESVPVEAILKAYMDETMEEDVVEEVKEEYIQEPIKSDANNATGGETGTGAEQNKLDSVGGAGANSKLSFSDVDLVKDQFNKEERITAPKDIERLEELSEMRYNQRKLETDGDDDYDYTSNGNGQSSLEKLNISDELASLDALDVHVINEPELEMLPDLIIDDIELLD
jgi:hypothetical protein